MNKIDNMIEGLVTEEREKNVKHECIFKAVHGMDIICQDEANISKVVKLQTLRQSSSWFKKTYVMILCQDSSKIDEIAEQYRNLFFEAEFTNNPTMRLIKPGEEQNDSDQQISEAHIVIGDIHSVLALALAKEINIDFIQYLILVGCETTDGRSWFELEQMFKSRRNTIQLMMFCAEINNFSVHQFMTLKSGMLACATATGANATGTNATGRGGWWDQPLVKACIVFGVVSLVVVGIIIAACCWKK